MGERVIFKAVKGGLNGEEFVFEESGLCLVGRSSDSALRIPKEKDMRISRRHCLLILDPPKIRIRDLGSRNGTYVNGERLDAGTLGDNPAKITSVDRILKHGDEVSLGETSFKVEIPSMAPESESKAKPPPGTKVVQLSKPAEEKKVKRIVKAKPVDTGFFATAMPPTVPTSTSPMTEAIPRIPSDDQMEQTVVGADPTTIQGKPIPLGSPKKPGGTLTLKAKSKPSAAAPSPAVKAPAPSAGSTGKRPVVLKGKKVEPQAGAPAPKPLKAKIVRKPSAAPPAGAQNPDMTEVLDVNDLADDTALGEDYKRVERTGKRVTKFKIKKPK